MYSLYPGNKMLRSMHLIKGCCRCKLTLGHKNKEGTLIFKNYTYSSSFSTRRNVLAPLYLYNVSTVGKQHVFRSCYDNKIRLLGKFNSTQYTRNVHTSNVIFGSESKKPSSKVEVTTEAIKEKTKEKSEKGPTVPVPATGDKKEVAVKKKPLRQRIMDEIYHYYHGFRLLFIDIRVSSSLVWKVLKGGTLTRREYNLLIRTVGDMFRLVPFSIFIIVPFMELLLPVFIKLFPGMLPSTFQTATEKDDKMKQSLKVKLEMAKFLQQTLDEMAVTGKGHSSKGAKEFIEFFEKFKFVVIQNDIIFRSEDDIIMLKRSSYINKFELLTKVRAEGGGLASNEEILKFSKLFEDEITLDSLTRSQLMALCRVLELQPFGTTTLLRFQLRMKLRSLAADDVRIKKEGVESLTQTELQAACRARGMRALGMSEDRMRAQLTQWLDLSLNEKVPPSLLLLSRAFMLPETITTTEKLVATISALPETVVTKTKVVIGEREGKVDNKTKIDLIKEEVARIKEEKKEEEEATVVALPPKDDELLVDKAPLLKDTATLLDEKPKEDKDLSAKDIGETLEDVLDAVGKDKKKMIIEKEELDDLKEEMKDYQEDIQNLKDVTILAKESYAELEVKESKAAKRLSKTVNKMIMKMDVALSELEKKELSKKEALQKEDSSTPSDDMLRVDELINAIHKMQKVPDSSKLENIIKVLGKIDADKDGVVKVDDVLKVLEVIGRENIKLKEKQIDEIIELLRKEGEADESIVDLTPEKTKDSKNNYVKNSVAFDKQENANICNLDNNLAVSEEKEPTSKNSTDGGKDSNKSSFSITPSMEDVPKPPSSSASLKDIRKSAAPATVNENKSNGPGEATKKI